MNVRRVYVRGLIVRIGECMFNEIVAFLYWDGASRKSCACDNDMPSPIKLPVCCRDDVALTKRYILLSPYGTSLCLRSNSPAVTYCTRPEAAAAGAPRWL